MRALTRWAVGVIVACSFACSLAAQDAAPAAEEPAKKEGGLPFPLHTIDGSGGVAIVPTAYLCNPPAPGEALGLPAIGLNFAGMGEKEFTSVTLTETVRLADSFEIELGYAHMNLELGDFDEKIQDAGLPNIGPDHSAVHVLSARTPLIREGAFDTAWMPAVTVGVHYKWSQDVDRFNDRLAGTLEALGVHREEDFEFTLSATKMVVNPMLDLPAILTVGCRVTSAQHMGFLGYADGYSPELEMSVVQLLPANFALAAEYRSKPEDVDEVPGLIEEEEDWWDIGLAYIVNENLTFTAAYVHFGDVLDEEVHGGYLLATKYEF